MKSEVALDFSPSRRSKWILANLVSVWIAFACVRAADRPPNLIFILADDLGYGDLGCYGQQKTATPCLDRMASQGTRFTQFYAGATVCAPSRSVLLTGRHGGHTPVRGLPYQAARPLEGSEPPLPSGIHSLASLAKKAGYRTACIGKWGLGGVGTSGDANTQGFDLAYGYVAHGEAHNYYPKFLWRNGQQEPVSGYSHDRFTEEALKFIKESKDRPFFLFLPYTIPHFNLTPPSLEPYGDKNWGQIAKQRAAMISRLDRDVGTILETLATLGIEKETLVLFSSDNGPTPENQAPIAFFEASGGLRGIKRDLYEGGIRVPMIAWWPLTVPGGRTSKFIGSFCDILPTFAELEGASAPAGIDGISFLSELKGQTDRQRAHDFLYWETVEKNGQQAVRMGPWKGIVRNVSQQKPTSLELYNLDSDPGEKTDLAAQNPAVVNRILEVIRREHSPSELFPLLFEERKQSGMLKGKKKPAGQFAPPRSKKTSGIGGASEAEGAE